MGVAVRARLVLVRALVERQILTRSVGSLLGFGWVLLVPVVQFAVFVVAFQGILRLGRDEAAYPLALFTALLPWRFFQSALSRAMTSVTENAALVGRMILPRDAFPLAAVLTNLVDLVCNIPFLAVLFLWYHVVPSNVFLSLAFLLLEAAFCFGCGLVIAGIFVFARDVQPVLQIGLQLLFFLTPVVWRTEWLSPPHRPYLLLNPAAPFIEGFRRSLLGEPGTGILFAAAAAWSAASILLGLPAFRRMSTRFGEVI